MNRKNNALVRSQLGVSTCRRSHEHGPAKITLVYNTENVLAFGFTFKFAEPGLPPVKSTTWLSRDLLADWLKDAPAGATLTMGEITVRVRTSAPHVLIFKLPPVTLSDGVTRISPMLMVSRQFLQVFLGETYQIVPRDDDAVGAYLQIDACIEQILSAGK